MLKLMPLLVLLTVHAKAREAEYLEGFEVLGKAAGESAVEDDVFVGIGESRDDGLMHATIKRKKPTMVLSDWNFSHEPGADPAGDFVYRKSFLPDSDEPQQVIESVRQMLVAPLSD